MMVQCPRGQDQGRRERRPGSRGHRHLPPDHHRSQRRLGNRGPFRRNPSRHIPLDDLRRRPHEGQPRPRPLRRSVTGRQCVQPIASAHVIVRRSSAPAVRRRRGSRARGTSARVWRTFVRARGLRRRRSRRLERRSSVCGCPRGSRFARRQRYSWTGSAPERLRACRPRVPELGPAGRSREIDPWSQAQLAMRRRQLRR
jgi:hypothetical protein